jgi:hypothetical protein
LQNVINYFSAIAAQWPDAWKGTGKGNIINRTNGFNGFVRFLRPAYLHFTKEPAVVPQKDFASLFRNTSLKDGDFNAEQFVPGTSGSTKLYHALLKQTGVEG